MTDVDPEVADSFERIFPAPAAAADWEEILGRAGVRRDERRDVGTQHAGRRRVVALAAATLIVVAGAASAFATAQGLFFGAGESTWHSTPAWSPDGQAVAFVSNRDGNPEIYAMNADGSGQTRLTDPSRLASGARAASNDSPDWSPDGQRIAFASNRSALEAWRLYSMRADGSDVQPLTDNPVPWHNERRPAWSRDGTKVAYVSGPGRDIPVTNSEIYVVDADGANERRLTRTDEADTTPSWAPDGRLAIARELGRLRPEIYIVPAAGGQARKLTGGTMTFRGFTALPARPRAGRLFTADLEVSPQLTGERRFADVACYAAVGSTLLDVSYGGPFKGKLRCRWFIPQTSKGKRLLYLAAARFGHVQISRTVRTRIE
jgi:WD40-like Beta Propeller Repeat